MKKICLICFLLVSVIGISQTNTTMFTFNTIYYDAVDKWVVLQPKEGDNSAQYTLGFIYIDEQAGFTFHLYKDAVISLANNQLTLLKNDSFKNVGSVKYRIENNWKKVAALTNEQVAALNLPQTPDWLSIYKTNENTVNYLVRIGYLYNDVGASHNAVAPLLKAYKIDATNKDIASELGFAYNALEQFTKTIEVLKPALENNPTDTYIIKELGYAYAYAGELDNAETVYTNGIQLTDNNNLKAEMAVNMTLAYYRVKNKEKFTTWAATSKKYAEKGSGIEKLILKLENSWNK